MRRAQAWAIDALIGAGIFILGFSLFFYIVNQKAKSDNLAELLAEVQRISTSVSSTTPGSNNRCSFLVNNKIDRAMLQKCAENYDRSKVALGVKDNYCIYFVNSAGNLINISSITNNSGIGIGSGDINYTLVDENGTRTSVVPCSR